MKRCLACLAVIFFVLICADAYAQNAQVSGTVTDASGGVLPGVTVTVASVQTGFQRSAATDTSGSYLVPALPPGRYNIKAALDGFATHMVPDVTLTIEQTAQVNFKLALAAVEERVTVTGVAPLVDVTRSEVTTSVVAEQMASLPVAQRRWTDLGTLVPGSSQDAVRGDHRNNVNLGASVVHYSTTYVVDGINNTWAEQGESRQNFPIDAIEEFKATTVNMKAEIGLATGGALSVVTKSGTNELHGLGNFFFRDAALTAKEYFQADKPDYRRDQFGGTIGGPIKHDRTHYFVAYDRINEDLFLTVDTHGVWPQYEGTFKSPQFRWAYMGKITHQLSRSQNLFFRYADDAELRPIYATGGITHPSASWDLGFRRRGPLFGHTWVPSDRVVNELRAQYAFARYDLAMPYSAGQWKPGEFGDRFSTEFCTTALIYPSLQLGGCPSEMGHEARWQVRDDISYLVKKWGTHQWKAGVDYSYIPFDSDATYGVKGQWTFPKDAPYNANDPSTWPIQYTDSLARYRSVPSTWFSVYLQDDWSPASGLVFNLGLRYDLQRGPFNENLHKAIERVDQKLGPGHGFPLEIPFHQGSDRRGDGNNVGPRVGVAWDPAGNGNTNIHGAYGLLYESVRSLVVPSAEIDWPQSQTIVIQRPSYPDPFNGASRDRFLPGTPPNISVLSNDLVNPFAHHFNVGVRRQLGHRFAVSADAVWVKRHSDSQVVDVNLPDPLTGRRPYPQFSRVSTTESTLGTSYRAVYIQAEKRLSDRYQFTVSYTLSKAEETGLNSSAADFYGYKPVTNPNAADRRHRLTPSGIVRLPGDFQASVILSLSSSRPFNPTSSFDLNRDGYTGDLPAGVARFSGCRDLNVDAINAFRNERGLTPVPSDDVACPGWANLDIRLSKFFTVRGSHRLELIGQFFNLLNRANFGLPVSNPGSRLFGQVIQLAPSATPSRQVEFAVRYQF